MTVTFKEEIAAARDGNFNGRFRTYTRAFLLTSDSQSDGPYAVGSNASLPVFGSPHDEDSAAFCIDIDVRNTDPWAGWTVTCKYSSEFELNVNPLFEPAQIDWGGEKFEEVLVADTNGDAVLNSAGDWFENAMRERTRRLVNVVKNVSAVPTWIIDAEDAVNSAVFLLDGFSIPIGKAKLGAPDLGTWSNRNGTRFRVMTMQFTLSKDGWAYTPLDQGYRFKDGLGDRRRIQNDDGTDVTAPVCLDGAGLVLSNPTPATAVFGNFTRYPAYDFNLLPLT